MLSAQAFAAAAAACAEPRCVMSAILRFLRVDTTFAPETLIAVGVAFDKTCASLQCGAMSLYRETVAADIIALAGRGVCDADRLYEPALQALLARQQIGAGKWQAVNEELSVAAPSPPSAADFSSTFLPLRHPISTVRYAGASDMSFGT